MAASEVSNLIPFVHVSDLTGSIAFYERLGFAVTDTHEHDGALDWAALEAGAAQLMLARAQAPIDRAHQAGLFYLHADDLAALRDRLWPTVFRAARSATARPGPATRWVWWIPTATA
jgi:hypothetical protein